MTTRETSFWESDHPGIVFPGKKTSGKVTIRETTVNLAIYEFLDQSYLRIKVTGVT